MLRTPLAPLHEARGAHWMAHQGWEIPAWFTSVQQEYQALQEGAVLLDLSHRQLLRVTGRDRRSWLHGQVTQDVNGLPDGRGAYATVITPKGKMVSDLRIFALPDELLLDAPAGATPLAEYLERFLIMERAQIESVSASHALVSVQGPLARCVVASVFGAEASAMDRWEIRPARFQGRDVHITRSEHCGEDGFDAFVPAQAAPALWAALCQSRREFAVHSCGWEALNVRRVEAGIPWWGEELDGTLIPLEARLDRAISLHKGCYVGQEIIARIDGRGQVNNLLAGFLVHGDSLPARDVEIRHQGRRVGRVCTALQSLRLGRPIALGFLRREHQASGNRYLTADTTPVELEVAPLPFVPDDFPSLSACPEG